MLNLKFWKKSSLLYSYAKFFLSFSLSLFLSFLVANSYENPKINNDLKTYSLHYECLQDGFSSIGKCSGLIGNPIDVSLLQNSTTSSGPNGLRTFRCDFFSLPFMA